MNDDNFEGLVYAAKEPDLEAINEAYSEAINDLEGYYEQCRDGYDDRRCQWPGKNRDLRKNGADAFPWDGASDIEAPVIHERINHVCSVFMTAMARANIRALPTNAHNVPRHKIVGNFLKWMATSGYIPNFEKEMELGANYLLERGMILTYVGS